MLERFPVYPVLPASDLQRARAWYEEKLAMRPWKEDPGGLWYACAEGTWLLVYPTDRAGTAQNTQAHFQVTDIEFVLAELRGAGVKPEEYESFKDFHQGEGLYDMDGTKVAFLKDSEGNTIELAQVPQG